MSKKLAVCFLLILLFNWNSFATSPPKPRTHSDTLAYAVKKSIKGAGPDYKKLPMERLDRGLVAFTDQEGEACISWRWLPEDQKKRGFDVYRQTDRLVKLNEQPISKATFYRDELTQTNEVACRYLLTYADSHDTLASCSLYPTPYISIPLPPIEGDSAGRYHPNDASVGDLDGDGRLEIILKRQIGNFACSQPGISGGTNRLEAYTLDGKRLWHIDLGVNIREGAQYFQFIVYDLDGDHRAEIICKTAEGTRFGDGTLIGDTNGDGITDYVIKDKRLRTYGKVLDGPEFISVIEGTTGKELARAPYIFRGRSEDWGDDYGNRVDRQLAAVAYLDGQHPSYIVARGYNGRSVIEAWDYRAHRLIRRWHFDTHDADHPWPAFADQGNHNIRIGDVDADGCDEIIYGACAIDQDGTGLYSTGWGHGDAMHLTDIDPERPGLEVWQCHEYAPTPFGSTLREAETGKLLFSIPSDQDVGRALCADIDPRYRGCELWSSASGGVYTAKGQRISSKTPSINMAIWWDGDLNRELLDHVFIDIWTGDGTIRLFDGRNDSLTSCNGTKATPCLEADILGDWREEVIWPTENGQEIRIYLSPLPTDHRLTCWLLDPVYRLSVATENVGYNQPTQPGFFLETTPSTKK
jgi:rhamnogalacturonan endolyase